MTHALPSLLSAYLADLGITKSGAANRRSELNQLCQAWAQLHDGQPLDPAAISADEALQLITTLATQSRSGQARRILRTARHCWSALLAAGDVGQNPFADVPRSAIPPAALRPRNSAGRSMNRLLAHHAASDPDPAGPLLAAILSLLADGVLPSQLTRIHVTDIDRMHRLLTPRDAYGLRRSSAPIPLSDTTLTTIASYMLSAGVPQDGDALLLGQQRRSGGWKPIAYTTIVRAFGRLREQTIHTLTLQHPATDTWNALLMGIAIERLAQVKLGDLGD